MKNKSTKVTSPKQNRRLWFRGMKKLMLGRYKKPRFIFLGEPYESGALILSNHEGTDAPMSLEIYTQKPIRHWGASEMNSGLISLYKYQTRVYYHEKKGWNLGLARLFCIIASPLTNLFYRGLRLISTYRDVRFMKTIKESIEAINRGENIVVYPEDSTNGYLAELEGFHAGFALFAETCLRRGMDLPIYVSYFNKKKRTFVFDAPVKYSELKAKYGTKEEVAKALVERCNELGKMEFSDDANAA